MLPFSKLEEDLDYEQIVNENGYPIEMDLAERNASEEKEYKECLQVAVEETLAFLALGGSL